MPQRPPIFRPPHATVKPAPFQKDGRPYDKRAYHRFRDDIFRERPLCEDCEAEGRLVGSEHVHHTRGIVRHPEDLCDRRYVLALCEVCHGKRTARGE